MPRRPSVITYRRSRCTGPWFISRPTRSTSGSIPGSAGIQKFRETAVGLRGRQGLGSVSVGHAGAVRPDRRDREVQSEGQPGARGRPSQEDVGALRLRTRIPLPPKDHRLMRRRLARLLVLSVAAACRPAAPAAPDPGAPRRRRPALRRPGRSASARTIPTTSTPTTAPIRCVRRPTRSRSPWRRYRTSAESLIAILGDSVPAYADSLVRLRHRYLRVQLGVDGGAGADAGRRAAHASTQEAEALYDATPPHYPRRALRLAARAARQPAARPGTAGRALPAVSAIA